MIVHRKSVAVYIALSTLLAVVLIMQSCKYDVAPEPFDDGCYPPEVAEILVKKCATSGCHNTISKDAASGLDLSSWEAMFQGNRNGAVCVPYRSDQSTLFFYINTDTLQGPVSQPTMPFNASPLTAQEIQTIKSWIDAGAPDCRGRVKFADNPNRPKFYIANQGCDLISIHDADTKVAMRCVNVGNSVSIESPHMIRKSPDGQYWYVSFINGNVLQKYRTSDDSLVGEAVISQGSWNTFALSPDGTKAWVVDFSVIGRVAYVDLVNMQLLATYQDPGLFSNPHGSAVSPNGDFLYVTGQLGNKIYKFDLSTPLIPDYTEININTSGGPVADPHEIAFSPDGNKYFVTCQGRNEVRIFNASNDAFIDAIPTAAFPLEMTMSPTNKLLFVSCEVGNSVTVIDMDAMTHVKDIFVGFQPHGLAVDEAEGVVYVANRNTSTSGGPIPHHTSSCGGRNGYLTMIDLNTLNLVSGFKMELSVDPYSVFVR
ncbi:MAG: YncE family protein [Bacteroidota bacterium]